MTILKSLQASKNFSNDGFNAGLKISPKDLAQLPDYGQISGSP